MEHILPADGPVVNDVHRHDFHELFFFGVGTGEHMIDLQQWSIAAPCMHLVAPGQVHRLDRSADMQGSVVMFATDAQLGQGHAARIELFNAPDRACTVALDEQRLAEARMLVRQMEEELARTSGPVAEVVEGYLGILLIKCAHWARSNATVSREQETIDPVRRFTELVELQYLQERQVAHFADLLAMTADHLNTCVKKRTGRTASSVIHDRLLLEAKRLLLHADLSIKEVGFALGMQDPAYFTRWFHKAAAATPAAFRASIREKYQH